MDKREGLQKIAFFGTCVPRQCGIATFTYDLCRAIAAQYPKTETLIVPVNDIDGGYEYPSEVRFEVAEQDIDDYHRAADFLNFSNCDAVSLQHEFGIFGGEAGAHVLALLRALHMPVVTTLHTVLQEPDPNQYRVMKELAALSARLVVMSQKGRELLETIYQVPSEKIDVIAHGIPDMPFVDPNFYKDQFGVEGKFVLLTFGLISPNKGIENVLRALPDILAQVPNVVYIVLGATHPALLRREGESYRLGLERLARELGIKKNVIFYNRFVDIEELKEFLGAADIYITPYLHKAQVTSGTLSYAFGCGKAVVSTPYWHAEELLADARGVLVPFDDPEAIAKEVIALLRDEPRRHAMRKRAYMLGREMVWSNVAHLYMESLQKARMSRLRRPRPFLVKTLDEERVGLPAIKLDHLLKMTDSTGILQHARFSIPHLATGYCTDDNARGLVLAMLLDEAGVQRSEVTELAVRCAAFVEYAYNEDTRRFRNFMSFDRHWQEDGGSDDCQGRVMWALGTCIGRSRHRQFQMWALPLFERVLPIMLELTSPRAWATALLGINEYCRRLRGDRLVHRVRRELAERLVRLYKDTATPEWPWFEEVVSYDNGKLPQALIQVGRWLHDAEALDIGLRSLRWLVEVQTSKAGHFAPIGSDGFYRRGDKKARFDQQPLEAQSMTAACLEAYFATDDLFWYDEARKAFEWFLGRNDLGLPIYDPNTGGCHDALHVDRVNLNQGAESTLSFLLALTHMRLVESRLTAFNSPAAGELAPPAVQRSMRSKRRIGQA
ncbi:MAG: glycosyltransferase family 4 protein [candidate division KSB1 bacterium]|nr:glycosyltransferase family 4 protein [candidate division KSB1 bacterium]